MLIHEYKEAPEVAVQKMQAWKENYDYGIRAEIQSARLLNNNTKKGNNWNSPKVYQISILNFHYGKDDNGDYLLFDDACNIMYVNGDYRGDNALGKLMHDFSTPNADEMYYNELARKVRFHKQDEKGVQMASQIVEEYGDERAAEALQKGIAQGIQQHAIEAAIKLLKNNKLSPEEIADTQGLSLEQVLELQKSVTAEV